jgi:hypothetical protein
MMIIPELVCAKMYKSLLDGWCTRGAALDNFGLPRFNLGLDSVVGPVCTAGTSQIFDPWLASMNDMAHTNEQGREVRKDIIHTAFHDGVELCMTASCAGDSFRMWESHECHSAGTCEALKSC